jgi:lysozyme
MSHSADMNMDAIISELELDEGVRLSPYRCTAGFLTIGVGRNLDTNKLTAEELAFVGHNCRTKPITKEQSDYLLKNDIEKVCADLMKFLPWWAYLGDVRKRVLVNMAFNLGTEGLLKFENTLALIRSGSYAQAAAEMVKSKWAKQVGKRADRLANMMRTGEVADD